MMKPHIWEDVQNQIDQEMGRRVPIDEIPNLSALTIDSDGSSESGNDESDSENGFESEEEIETPEELRQVLTDQFEQVCSKL